MGGGAASGGIATGTMEGVMWGAFSGAVFFGVGQAFGGTAGKNGLWGSSFKDADELARASLAHGVAGGTISHLQGGKFGHGFVSAGVSKSFSTRISGAFDGKTLAQGTATAIVGGTTSRLTGGKFANGAVTAAMAFAFNQLLSSRHPENTEAWAKDMAQQMRDGGSNMSAIRNDDGTWTYGPTDSLGIRAAFGVEAAGSIWNGAPPGFCASFCGTTAPMIGVAAGDMSGSISSSQLNQMSKISSRVDQSLDVLAQNHRSPDVRAFSQALRVAPNVTRGALLVPATVNNYRACYANCTTGLRRYQQ